MEDGRWKMEDGEDKESRIAIFYSLSSILDLLQEFSPGGALASRIHQGEEVSAAGLELQVEFRVGLGFNERD